MLIKKTVIFTMTHDTINYKSNKIGVNMWELGDILQP